MRECGKAWDCEEVKMTALRNALKVELSVLSCDSNVSI